MNSASAPGAQRVIKGKKSFWKGAGRWLAGAVIVLAVGIGVVWIMPGGGSSLLQQVGGSPTPDYHTAVVQRGDLQIAISGTGSLAASRAMDLSFSAKGLLTELHVKAGERVKAGQVLAKIGNTASLEAAVAKDQLLLLQAQQALDTLQKNTGTALAQSFLAMLETQKTYNDQLDASQRTSSARCSKEVNTRNAATLKTATDKLNEISRRYYGSDAWIMAKNNYDNALANYSYCITYTGDEKTNASASLQVAKFALDQAKANYDTLSKNSGADPVTLTLAQAKLKQAETQLTLDQQALQGTTLTAPFDGTVTYLAAGAGAMVDTSKFITISDLSHPIVDISVDESDLDKFKIGSQAEVVFDALPNRVFKGQVAEIDPILTTSGQMRLVTGLITLDPETSAKALANLPLGLTASVTVIESQALNTLLVPIAALREVGSQQYAIFVKSQDGKLQLRQVKVGLTDSARAEILSGLNAGDVISTGISQAR